MLPVFPIGNGYAGACEESVLCQKAEFGVFPLSAESDGNAGSRRKVCVVCKGCDEPCAASLAKFSVPKLGDLYLPGQADLPVLFGLAAGIGKNDLSGDVVFPGSACLGRNLIPGSAFPPGCMHWKDGGARQGGTYYGYDQKDG